MPVKIYKPTTPARRKTSVSTFEEITDKSSVKYLLKIKKSRAGRNVHGKITVRHRGGGAKKYYRVIDFKRNKFDIPAVVEAVEYDPNRSARIALLKYRDGERRYMVAPLELKVGDEVVSSNKKQKIAVGNRMPLKYVPMGIMVYNIELIPGKGAQLVRSAGTGAMIMAVEGKYAQIKLPSTEIRLVPKDCLGTIGQVSNVDHKNIRLGKAGRKRRMGIRPTVRGKAMNPVDHPHGGGEGCCPIGMKAPKTPWGKKALGVKTRKNNRSSNRMIVQRRKNKKRK